MNINQYDIKYYLRSDSRNEVSLSEIKQNNNNYNTPQPMLNFKTKQKLQTSLKKKFRIFDEENRISKRLAMNSRIQERSNPLSKREDPFTDNMSIMSKTSLKFEDDNEIPNLKKSTIIGCLPCKKDNKFQKTRLILRSRPISPDVTICPNINNSANIVRPVNNEDLPKSNNSLLDCIKSKKLEHEKSQQEHFLSTDNPIITKEDKAISTDINDYFNKTILNTKSNKRAITIRNRTINANSIQNNKYKKHNIDAGDANINSSFKSSNNSYNDSSYFSNIHEKKIEKKERSNAKSVFDQYSLSSSNNFFYDRSSTFKARENRIDKKISSNHQKTFDMLLKKQNTLDAFSLVHKSIKGSNIKLKSKEGKLDKKNDDSHEVYLLPSSAHSSYTQIEAENIMNNIIVNIKNPNESDAEIPDPGFHSHKDSNDFSKETNTKFNGSLNSFIKSKHLTRIEINRSLKTNSLAKLSISIIKSKIDSIKSSKTKAVVSEFRSEPSITDNHDSLLFTMEKKLLSILSYTNVYSNSRRESKDANVCLVKDASKELILKKYFDAFAYFNNFDSNRFNKQKISNPGILKKKTYYSQISILNPGYNNAFHKADNCEFIIQLIFRDLVYQKDKDKEKDKDTHETDKKNIEYNKRHSRSVNNLKRNRVSLSKEKKTLMKKKSFHSRKIKYLILNRSNSSRKKDEVKKTHSNKELDNIDSTLLKTFFKLKSIIPKDQKINDLKNETDSHLINKMLLPINTLNKQSKTKYYQRKRKLYNRKMKIRHKRGRLRTNEDRRFYNNIQKYNEIVNEEIIEVIKEQNMPYLKSALIKKERNINLQYQDEDGNSFVHWSVIANCPEICEFLIQKGCDHNMQNLDLDTPLHLALERKLFLIVNILLKYKADEGIINKKYLTPWQSLGIKFEDD